MLGVGFGLAVTIGGTIGMGILRTPAKSQSNYPRKLIHQRLDSGRSLRVARSGFSSRVGRHDSARAAGMCSSIARWELSRIRSWLERLALDRGTLGVIALVSVNTLPFWFPLAAATKRSQSRLSLFVGLQWRGIRWGSFTQNLTSAIKTLIFVAIAIAAFTITERPIRAYQQRRSGFAFYRDHYCVTGRALHLRRLVRRHLFRRRGPQPKTRRRALDVWGVLW